MPNYSLRELASFMGFSEAPEAVVTGFATDSRLLKPGELYFALRGERVDGHVFISEVAAKGAVGAVVDRSFLGDSCGLPLFHVEDVLKSLQQIARTILAVRKPLVVAVTGSVGKTTTKEFIAGLLRSKFIVANSPGNSNSQVGLPLAILNHTEGREDVLVLEMGMTNKGDIAGLVQIAPPHVAVITTTALVHACNFEGLEEIGRTKAEIFSHPQTQVGILDRGIVNFDELIGIGNCRKLSFSLERPDADFRMWHSDKKMIVVTPEGSGELNLLQLHGLHNRHNFLAAVAVARTLGLEWEDINRAMPLLLLPERRLQMVEKDGVLFVNDSYNACEVSVKAALNSLPEPGQGGKKIAVLGGMVELGKFSLGCHQAVGQYALDCVDSLFCFGSDCKAMRDIWAAAGRPVVWAEERIEVVRKLREVLSAGDVVLLKGSRAKETWKVLEEL
ncbi:MAG: UDP-N-acetylmuramoyl-tripeptide--D-alanyl-D-alanine ligase [Parachlamydia sp.]|nr:UDP-N-acetylmuramoyl-tripeptide--D-alanyl-D-alanine ligase [Parachlamydia sp.]